MRTARLPQGKRKDIDMDERKFIEVTDIGFEGREGNKEKYPKEVFCYILKGTPFERYAFDIFDKLLSIKYGNVSLSEEERMMHMREYFQKQKDIAESLLLCKENKELGLCAGSRQSRLPANIKEIIEKVLEDDYRESKLNFEPMTFEQGKEILEQNLCEDVHGFIDDYWNQYAYELGFTAEEMAGGYSYDDITDDMVEMYIADKEMSVEITEEQIKGKILSLKKEIKEYTPTRKGAPKKNIKLHCAINVFQDTKQYKPSNKTYRIIYECLDFLEMIDKKLKKMWATTTSPNPEVSYMKALCREASKYQAKILPF